MFQWFKRLWSWIWGLDEIQRFARGLVKDAENYFGNSGTGKVKFEWVKDQLLKRFRHLKRPKRKHLVRWIIEQALAEVQKRELVIFAKRPD